MSVPFFSVIQLWNSSRAKSARASLSKQLTRSSLRVKRLNLKKMETASSILNYDTSSSGKYVSSSLQEKSQADFASTLPDISEESVEMQKNSDRHVQFEDDRVGSDPGGEEKVLNGRGNSDDVSNLTVTLNQLV